MNNSLRYLLHFLLGEELPEEIVGRIGYTSDRNKFDRYALVIVPSGFFSEAVYGTPASLPALPLAEVEGVPLLFGSQKMEWVGDTWVVHADIVASAYFLLTRYEEMVRRNIRDEHGRFPGKESLPYRAGFLHRPVVDEYRRLLRRWLRQARVHLPDVVSGIRHVYLTHDVDAPFLYRSWKGLLRSLHDGRGICPSFRGKFGNLEEDPYYTFPRIFRENDRLRELLGKERCETLLFIRGGGGCRQDKPHYRLGGGDMQKLIEEARRHDIRIGLHASYQAGINPALLPAEKHTLEKHAGQTIRDNRHHFLGLREPEDTDRLEAAGLTDDFTMGYADVAGFRLGTARPVRWINPVTRRLSPLRLHPLAVMDCSLREEKYMGLDAEAATAYCQMLIRQVREAGGELTLLWHNTSFVETPGNYLPMLYFGVLNELRKETK